jgi:hypothetical protein
MVLDGVVDADAYVTPMWEESIQDADGVLSTFFNFCLKAEGECDFWRPNDTEASIEARYSRIMENLRQKHGVVILEPQRHIPELMSYSDVKSLIFQALYSPVQLFPLVAKGLHLLEIGDELRLGMTVPKFSLFLEYEYFCPPIPRIAVLPAEAQQAIMCSDKRYPVSSICHTTLSSVCEMIDKAPIIYRISDLDSSTNPSRLSKNVSRTYPQYQPSPTYG